jgi:hypothetical protein
MARRITRVVGLRRASSKASRTSSKASKPDKAPSGKKKRGAITGFSRKLEGMGGSSSEHPALPPKSEFEEIKAHREQVYRETGMALRLALFAVGFGGMLVGQSLMHNYLQPDLSLHLDDEELESK